MKKDEKNKEVKTKKNHITKTEKVDIDLENRKVIHSYIITLLILLLATIIFYIPTSYDIDTDGGLINLYDRIDVTPSNEMQGSINSTYVGGIRGTIAMLIASKFIPSWDAYKASETRYEDETYQASLIRGKVSLKEAEQNAKYVALKEAGYDVEISSYNITVIYVYKEADTDLKVGDVIKKVNGVDVSTSLEAVDVISSHDLYEKINLTVQRNGKIVDCYAIIHELEDRNGIGIIINPIIELSYPDDINISFTTKAREYGSSGGLMNALLIYNKLTKEDITKGDVISGTGELYLEGYVLPVSGVKYKLRGAYKSGARVFIVPTANYEEAMQVKNKNNMDIEIIKAEDFKSVVETLKMRKK